MSGLRYIGDGAFIPGVPARDLNAEEAKQYAAMIDATAAAGHVLYVIAVTKRTATATIQVTTTTEEAKDGRDQ